MKNFLYKIRSNHLIVLSFLVFIVTTILILFEIDRQYYQVKKKEIIIANWEQVFPELTGEDNLSKETQNVLLTRDIIERKDKSKALQELCNTIITAPNSIYKIEILDNNSEVIYSIEDKIKFKKLNTFKNSLLLKNFSGKQSKVVPNPDIRRRDILGRILINYTSPKEFPLIEQLTQRYWLYCLIVVFGLSAIYLYTFNALLLPVKRVISCLDKANLERPVIIKNPLSLLEKVYNNLAREASLNRLNQKIQEFASKSTTLDITKLLEELPNYIIWLLRFKDVYIYEFRRANENNYHLVTAFYKDDSPKNVITLIESEIIKHLNNITSHNVGELEIKESQFELKYQNNGSSINEFCFISPVEIKNSGDLIIMMAILPGYSTSKYVDIWKAETFKRVCDLVRNGLKQIEYQRKIIFKEKSEANISLSRNLGHDLTNIIATSKLDLLAVQHFLSLPGEEIMSNPQKEKIFKEALSGLLNNTKFLQEIVNLYRSFTYIKRPKFEIVNLNQALDEIVTIFDISISKNINIIKKYDIEIPPLKIEQRLVKLAVFNILTNGVDSIKRKASESGSDDGEIVITTKYDKANNEIMLSLKDNGTGIKNQRGELASPHEIERIFYLGYTTKKDEEGEGLGLNWVWTIIHDFHQGRIIPRNHPDGGAEFIIYFKKDFEPQLTSKEVANPFDV